VVLDAGCGTGKSLPALSAAVGPTGRVIALEPCAAMLRQARDRAATHRLGNIQFLACEAESLTLHIAPGTVDAFLLMFTHDLLQSQTAIRALLAAARPGARMALAGGKFFSGPLALLNPWVRWRQRPYCTTFANYDAPWRTLFDSNDLRATSHENRLAGIAYLAAASVPQKTARARHA
jgi:SAM-dependent methyltransferase